MSESSCPECGAPQSPEQAGAPCSACLMKLGMQSWQDGTQRTRDLQPTQSYDPSQAIPSTQELATHFPQLEIASLIGRGGMGAVYKARQKSLDRTVALKLIRSDATNDPSFAERFLREARALAQLSHPNIVTVHDFGQASEYYYFIMEFIDGANLRHLIKDGKLTADAALKVVPDVCDALQYAHDQGVVHRDIKPENILVDKRGVVKIADFGLAKLVNKDGTQPTLTQTHQVMGTMHYMAPEQLEKPLTVDHRADIYSLGVVIYEMLTGELPIGRFAPPSKKVQIDVRLDEIVLHSLEKEPDLRYQHISQVKTDMQAVSDHSLPRPPMQPQRLVRERSPSDRLQTKQPLQATPPAKPGPHPFPMARERISFLGSVFDRRTYSNLLYLFLSFIVGIFYFVFLVTGLSTGLSLLIVWIGAFVLVGTLLAVRGLVNFERLMANGFLDAQFADNPFPEVPEGVWRRVKWLFTDRTTLTGILYLFLKFPLGIISFVAVVTTISTPVSMILQVAFFDSWWWNMSFGFWEPDTRFESGLVAVLGVFLLFPMLWLTNSLAAVHRMLAQRLLRKS